MASDLNSINLVGRLTRDPELRSLPSGTSVAQLRLAFTTSKKTASGWEDQPNYIDVSVWGNQGEQAAKFLSKGSRVGISGRLEYREWEKDGQTRSAHSISANSVQFLTPKGEGQSQGQATQAHSTPPVTTPAPAPVDEDDIPF